MMRYYKHPKLGIAASEVRLGGDWREITYREYCEVFDSHTPRNPPALRPLPWWW